MMFTRRHGLEHGECEETTISFLYSYCISLRYLSPSFLASTGALGYVAYAFAQDKPVPSSPNVSFLHLIGVAGGLGISFWVTAIHGRTIDCIFNIVI